MNIVISQPFFLPWIGLFEQLRLSDIFVHFDDVQMQGQKNFIKRVQIKTDHGSEWLTIPVKHVKGIWQNINEVKISNEIDWRKEHLQLIRRNYKDAAYYNELVPLLDNLYGANFEMLSDYIIFGVEKIAAYFEFSPKFIRSSSLPVSGKKSQLIFDLVKYFNGDRYISGHGALNYAEYDLFDNDGISFEYIDYEKRKYPQLYGEFTPYVSVIDLIANCGKTGRDYICSKSIYWKDFIKKQQNSVDAKDFKEN